MGSPANLLSRFDPARLDDLLNNAGWSDQDEIEALVRIASCEELKGFPSALAAIKMIRDRITESLQLAGLIQKVQGHISGTREDGTKIETTTTAYRLGSETQRKLDIAFGRVPALPVLEGEIVEQETENSSGNAGGHGDAPSIGNNDVEEAPTRHNDGSGCGGDSPTPSLNAGVVEQAGGGDAGSTDSTADTGEQNSGRVREGDTGETGKRGTQPNLGLVGVSKYKPPSVMPRKRK